VISRPCGCRRCWPRSTRSLHEIAPRLARARDSLLEERRRARGWRRWHGERELHLLWLVSHRELQLERANATGKGKYIDRRRRLLAEARVELAEHQGRAYEGQCLERAA
jgi:hypothetical protein